MPAPFKTCMFLSATILSLGLSINDASAKQPLEGPIIVKNGQVIAGETITSVTGPCIIIPKDIKNVRIQNNKIGPCGTSVDDVGIRIDPRAHHIYIGGNVIHDVSTAVFANHSDHPIAVELNTVYDIRGPSPMGQMVRFDGVANKGFKSRIFGNISDKNLSKHPTAYSDHILLEGSSGSYDNSILIACNKLRGGDLPTGSGITVGKNGGKWIFIRDNIIVLTPNTGIALFGVEWSRVVRNIIWNRGGNKESYTENALSVSHDNDTIPNNIEISKNLAIANSWVTKGDGSLSVGLSDDKTGKFLNYSANNWQYKLLKENIWNTSRDDCHP